MLKKCQRPSQMKNLFSQSQMEQSKTVEEIDVWDHPPQSRIVQNEEGNKGTPSQTAHAERRTISYSTEVHRR